MISVRLTRAIHGFEAGDSILAHPLLGPHFAHVHLIPARYAYLVQLDNLGAIEYLTGALPSDEVEALLLAHFRLLRRQESGLALLP